MQSVLLIGFNIATYNFLANTFFKSIIIIRVIFTFIFATKVLVAGMWTLIFILQLCVKFF